jgi:uncharacterized protein DUF1236
LASIRSAPPLGPHLLGLAHSGLENGAEGEWPQRERSAVEWFPADVLQWLLSNPNAPSPKGQEKNLPPELRTAKNAKPAAVALLSTIYSRQQADNPAARSRWRLSVASALPPPNSRLHQQTPSGKMGAEEPSSHTPNAKPQENAVFVNGALAVPGAPANTDTVPAKFSAKNAADDKLIIVAYTFKTLTDDERRAIYQALKDQPSSAFNADVGTEVPPGIELRPVPNEVAASVPQTRDYRYTVANDRVLLVGTSRIVVGVFAAAPTHP